jgi:hypothetical protein
MRANAVLGLTVLGLAQGDVRRPKKVITGSECHELPWLSTPKYPGAQQDNGRDDEGYYTPIKKEHTMRNYQMPIKGKKK